MYDDDYQQYTPRAKSPVPAAFFTALVTTVAVFFGLRYLDQRGALPGAKAAPQAAAAAVPAVVEVPAVVGLTSEQARTLLQSRGLVVGPGGDREDPRFAPGTVVAQTPVAGTRANRGGAVQVVVARAPGRVAVPNVTGMRPEDATKRLTAAGFAVAPQKIAASEAVAPGAVVGTDPPVGTAIAPRSAIALVVSTGPEGKLVPKVTGMKLARARKALTDAGFALGRTRYIYDDERGGLVVLGQEPDPGAAAPPGSPVNLIVNEGD